MNEIRFHGRGGQGEVTPAELLARATILENKFAQPFPSFGPERCGAPFQAFARVPGRVVRNRTAVVVLAPSVLDLVEVADGLVLGGALVVNSSHDLETPRARFGAGHRLAVVDANRIVHEENGAFHSEMAVSTLGCP